MLKQDWKHLSDDRLAVAIEAQAVANGEEWQPERNWDGTIHREDIFVRPAGSGKAVWRRIDLADFLAGK